MKTFTPRDLFRGGFRDAFQAAANGEDVYIVAGKSKGNSANPRAIHAYGETVASLRFKLIVDEDCAK